MRRHALLRAAARVAALDIFVLTAVSREQLDEMATTYAARTACVSSAASSSRMMKLLRQLRHPGSPSRVARADQAGLRRQLSSWAAMTAYDLTLVERIEDYLILAPVLRPPVVVDNDDRDSDVLRQIRPLLRTAAKQQRRPGLARLHASGLRNAGRDLYLAVEQFRWSHSERRVMCSADAVLVASREDQVTARDPCKTVLVPNGFDLRGEPAGSRDLHDPPTIAFWGLMSYRPNRDGAQWFLDEVLPFVVARIPDVQVLVIGAGGELLRLPRSPDVRATGFVKDLTLFLSQIDVAVVPLRAGGGTRIKIIEAWANNIPVVATSVGAYGLGAVDGENILLADEPNAFAAAVASIIDSPSLRVRLIEGGRIRARELRWSTIEDDLSRHLATMLGAASPGAG